MTGATKQISPGPAAYNIKRKFKKQCPPIKMKSRHNLEPERLNAPYYKVPEHFGKTPKVHMHYRTEEKNKFVTPGPNYVPPPFGKNGIKIGMSPFRAKTAVDNRTVKGDDGKMTTLGKRKNPDSTPGPGPGTYSTRTHELDGDGTKGIGISGHHAFDYGIAQTPGPSAYKPRYEKVLPAAPKYGMRIRPQEKDPEGTPGYRNLGSTLSGPKYTMKRREDDDIQVIWDNYVK